MNLPLYIAGRYLFAKKSHNAINLISMISVGSVALATTALVCVLSVFNGFNALVVSMFGNFDPELKITPATGKVFDPESEAVRRVCNLPEVALYTGVLQDYVLVRYNGRQEIAVAKGVSDAFTQMIHADSVLIDGRFVLQEGEISYAVLGVGLASTLGVNAGFVDPLEIYAPGRSETVSPSGLSTAFRLEYAFAGGVFGINQPVYDEKYLLLPIQLTRSLLDEPNGVSALELMLTPKADLKAVKKQICSLLGEGFRVQDRYEQQELSYKMMQVEKWVTFLILVFILTIALFNVVSSLSMLMIEKQDDVRMLRSMGANDRLIRRIFFYEGSMIPALGAVIGIATGVALCLVQQHCGLIKLGSTMGAFVMDDYPVQIHAGDLLTIFLTVCLIGLLVSWYPVRYLGKRWLRGGRGLPGGVLVAVLAAVGMGSCGGVKTEEQSVVVTIEPQRYFAGKIAGSRFNVYTVVPSGQSPETYDPAPQEMMRIGRSKAYLRMGRIGFEQVWMKTIRENNPQLAFFDLSEGVPPPASETDHRHGADPHIWSATGTAKIIAHNTLQAFLCLDPANEALYRANGRALLREIEATERALHAMLDTLTCRTFVIYHPALTYFADEFHLTQLAIESEGKEPSAASLKSLIDRAKEAKVRVVFLQEEFDRKHARQVAAEIGARLVVINPLDVRWNEQMIRIADELRK